MNKKQTQKKFHTIAIGPKLIECLEKQKDNVKKEGYDILEISYFDAGEILAKKILDRGLI